MNAFGSPAKQFPKRLPDDLRPFSLYNIDNQHYICFLNGYKGENGPSPLWVKLPRKGLLQNKAWLEFITVRLPAKWQLYQFVYINLFFLL